MKRLMGGGGGGEGGQQKHLKSGQWPRDGTSRLSVTGGVGKRGRKLGDPHRPAHRIQGATISMGK